MDEYYNNFTEYLDTFIVRSDKINPDWYDFCIRTYLCLNDIPDNPTEDFHIAFRVPGATRGHVSVDKDLIIKDIVFYHDTCWGKVGIYNKLKQDEMIQSTKDKFLGTILDLKNGITSDDFMDKYKER